MHYKITAPVGHTGVVAGVHFANGVASCYCPPLGAVEFLRRHGYTVVAVEPDHCHDHDPDVVVIDADPPTKSTTRTRRNKAGDTTTTTTTTEES